MRNALILGSLPNTKEDYIKYETVIKIAGIHYESVLSPINTKDFQGNDNERFERAVDLMKQCDLIIGELSLPSTGQGVEIGIGYTQQKPLLIIAKTGSNISGIIKGYPFLKDIIYYDDFNDLESQLIDFFN